MRLGLYIFASNFFLCFGYAKCQEFSLFSIEIYVNQQKQYIFKKVINVYKIYLVYLHDVQHASAGDHCLDQVGFPIDFYRSECDHCHFTFQLSLEHCFFLYDFNQFYSNFLLKLRF